ncbi:MAG: prolipoprotein diacylglyceryl transferase [Acidobacteriota bacterium]|nr:MAG: prolipoprotein diacylglyceryl transferase [Acidobacteriota bacterium]
MLPKLIEIGPIPIHTYGLLLATALLVAISVAARLAERDGIPRKVCWDLGFVIVLSSIIGAKLLMVLTSLDYYLSNPSRLVSLEFLQAGGVFYGGLLGAIFGSVIFSHRTKGVPFWTVGDAAAPAIALGQAIGRLGCFAAGCDYGLKTDLPWGVTFTSEYAHQVVGVPLNVALHPYQLYESFATFGLFLALLWAFHRRQFSGQILCTYLAAYGVLRFGLEFFRGDVDRGFLFDGLLSTSQFISLLVVPVALLLYFWRRKVHAQGKKRG